MRAWHCIGLFGLLAMACDGSDGKDGAIGPPGAQGPRGPEGDASIRFIVSPEKDAGASSMFPEGGVALSSSCLSPCHSFSGVLSQFQASVHYATYVANIGTSTADEWVGTGPCGNCHAIDGVQLRLANNVAFKGTTGPHSAPLGQLNYLSSVTHGVTESTYAGSATVAEVYCTTCHDVTPSNDPHKTGKNYTPGSFPLRAPTNSTAQVLVEKSSAAGVADGTQAGTYGKGNACIFCHKARPDITNYVSASTKLTSMYWGPHDGPQADIYTGKGGYSFAGQTYKTSSHQAFTDGCVKCHMPAVAANQGIGDHSMAPQLSVCITCHAGATSFDVIGGQSAMEAGIQELRVVLNNLAWLTRDTAAPYGPLAATDLADSEFQNDLVRPQNYTPVPDAGKAATPLTADQAGALYNYLLLARGSAGGVHNPVYTRELIYDSYKALTGKAPQTLPTRP